MTSASGLLQLPFRLVTVGLLLAAVAGDQLGHILGRRFGPRVFSRTESRFLSRHHAERAQAFFAKHGPKAVVLAGFRTVVRTFTPMVGVARMPRRRFTVYNVAGAIDWTTGLFSVGFYLGGVPLIAAHAELFAIGMVALLLVPALAGLVRDRLGRDQVNHEHPARVLSVLGRGEMGRDGNVLDAGIALRLLDDDLSTCPHHTATDADDAELHVDIATSEFGEFAEAHPAP